MSAPEVRKLAHTLGVAPDRLSMLGDVPAQDVRALRDQVGEALFRADRPAFARVAALSKAVPGALIAKLSEAAMPPLLAARTAELLEPDRAVDVVGRLSDGYLADVSSALDARRAAEVVAAIPPERVARVGVELARRGEWVVVGGFVSVVHPEALTAAVAALDGGDLLRISFVVDDVERLDRIVAMLTDHQVDGLLVEADEHALWDELGHLLDHLSPEHRARLADRVGDDRRATYAAGLDEAHRAVLGLA